MQESLQPPQDRNCIAITFASFLYCYASPWMRNVVKRFAFEIQLLVSPVYFLERCHYCWKLYRSNFSRFSSFASPSSSSSSSSFSSSLIISDNTEFRIDSPRLPLRQTMQHCAVSNNFATHDGRTIPGTRYCVRNASSFNASSLRNVQLDTFALSQLLINALP